MPIYESMCADDSCSASEVRFEWFAHCRDEADPPCPNCGGKMTRMASTFNAIWTGSIGGSKYYVPRNPLLVGNVDQKQGGHWVFEKKTLDGVPRSRYIETRQQQREFCRQEGLLDPTDLPTNAEVSADGKQLQWKGMPGQWL